MGFARCIFESSPFDAQSHTLQWVGKSKHRAETTFKSSYVRTLLHFAFTCFDTSNTSFKLLGESRRAKQKNFFLEFFVLTRLHLESLRKPKAVENPRGVKSASRPTQRIQRLLSAPRRAANVCSLCRAHARCTLPYVALGF